MLRIPWRRRLAACLRRGVRSSPFAVRHPPVAAPPRSRRPRLDDAGYLAIADRLAAPARRALERRAPALRAGLRRRTVSEVNADLLLVHAAAARAGTAGRRATTHGRGRSARFLDRPGDLARRRPQPGWLAGAALAEHAPPSSRPRSSRAWRRLRRARRARARGRDRRARSATARARRREPRPGAGRRCVMNQLNWYATIFAADATVNGAGAGARRRTSAGTSRASPPAPRAGRRGPATSGVACASTTSPRAGRTRR